MLRAELTALLRALEDRSPEFQLMAVKTLLKSSPVEGYAQPVPLQAFIDGKAKVLVVTHDKTHLFSQPIQVLP